MSIRWCFTHGHESGSRYCERMGAQGDTCNDVANALIIRAPIDQPAILVTGDFASVSDMMDAAMSTTRSVTFTTLRAVVGGTNDG